MAQITIYIDDQTLKQIEQAANRDNDSISKWVKKRLVSSLKKSWPDNYTDLFGSVSDESFVRPHQQTAPDRKRQSL